MVILLSSGCRKQDVDEDLPAILKIGVLPDEARVTLLKRYEPLRAYLSNALGVQCEFVYPERYETLVESLGEESLDLVYFGGLTYVQAMVAHDAVPLVVRDVDTRFTSYFLVRADDDARTIAEYKDMPFAFGARLSTSGHLMPRHFLLDQNIEPETFFSEVCYSGAHDRTVSWLRDGRVRIGAVNSHIYLAMVADGRVKKGEFRIVWETPPFVNYVWAVRSSLGKIGRRRLRNAFLVLSPERQEYLEVLRHMDAGGFYPADVEAFSGLKEIASNMGLVQ